MPESSVNPPPSRVVHHADAMDWLSRSGKIPHTSIITSLPDLGEFPSLSIDQWKDWFIEAAVRCFQVLDDDAIAVFYQTDRKSQAEWIDKAFLLQKAAEKSGFLTAFHRIVLRTRAGDTTHWRTGYAHLLGFSLKKSAPWVALGPDVIATAGATTWTRGMGVDACRAACASVKLLTNSTAILDPFCGHGTVLAVANEAGFTAIGVEIAKRRAQKARSLRVEMLEGDTEVENP